MPAVFGHPAQGQLAPRLVKHPGTQHTWPTRAEDDASGCVSCVISF